MKNYETHEVPNIGFIFTGDFYHPDDSLVKYRPYCYTSLRAIKEILGYYSKCPPKYDTKLIKILMK